MCNQYPHHTSAPAGGRAEPQQLHHADYPVVVQLAALHGQVPRSRYRLIACYQMQQAWTVWTTSTSPGGTGAVASPCHCANSTQGQHTGAPGRLAKEPTYNLMERRSVHRLIHGAVAVSAEVLMTRALLLSMAFIMLSTVSGSVCAVWEWQSQRLYRNNTEKGSKKLRLRRPWL